MEISYSSYSNYLGNPEKFRINKGLGLTPEVPRAALQRGSVLHKKAEGYFFKWTNEQFTEVYKQEDFSPEGIEAGLALWSILKEHIDGSEGTRIIVEGEYKVPIPDTQHFLIGYLDSLLRDITLFGVEDYKTAAEHRKPWEIKRELKATPQTCSLIMGGRHLGYDIHYVDYVVVQEGSPPSLWIHREEPTETDLQNQLRAYGQVADLIEFSVAKWGIDNPWPHVIHSQWHSDVKGVCNAGKCEYQEICNTKIEGIPAGFKLREGRLKP